MRNRLQREGFKGNVIPRGGEFIVRPEGSTFERADRFNLSGQPTEIVSRALREELENEKKKANKAKEDAEEAQEKARSYDAIAEITSRAGSDIGLIQDIPDTRGGGLKGKIVSDNFLRLGRPILQSNYDKRKESIRTQRQEIRTLEDEVLNKEDSINTLQAVRKNALANIGLSTSDPDQKKILESKNDNFSTFQHFIQNYL